MTAFERACEAVDAELKQHWPDRSGVAPEALVRAALGAIREPDEGMTGAAFNATADDWSGDPSAEHISAWRAMISAILAEGEGA